jgi:3-oxoadipate enol-lactonase
MPKLAFTHDVELNYADTGTGTPVWLLFNGNSLSLEFWGDLVRGLAQQGRVIRFDQRGVGATRAQGSFSLLDVAADAAHLLAHLGVPRVIAVGHAWGGRVAQVFARDHPHLVSALVLCGTGGQWPPRLEPGLQNALTSAAKDGDRQRWERALEELYCAPGYAARDPEDFAALSELMWPARSRPRTARWDARVAPSPTYWGTARVPTLLLYGQDDRFGTAQNAEDLARTIPEARLEYFENAGHFLIREARDQVRDAMLGFASGLTSEAVTDA